MFYAVNAKLKLWLRLNVKSAKSVLKWKWQALRNGHNGDEEM